MNFIYVSIYIVVVHLHLCLRASCPAAILLLPPDTRSLSSSATTLRTRAHARPSKDWRRQLLFFS